MRKSKIAILAPEHFCRYLEETSAFYHVNFSNACEIEYHQFSYFRELPQLYESLQDQYDGFCVAGNFTEKVIEKSLNEVRKPLQSIAARSVEYYKAFFQLLRKKRDIDLDRVIIDTYLWGGKRVPRSVEDFMQFDRLLNSFRDELLTDTSVEQIMQTEELMLSRARELMEKGEADWILCRQATSYPLLLKEGIPCSYVYPAVDSIVDSISLLLGKISINQLEEELPAVIYITSEELQKGGMNDISTVNLNLQKAILEYDQQNTLGFVIKQGLTGYEIYTTKQVIRMMTDQFTSCHLRQFIMTQTGMKVQIGYGISQTVMRARANAMEAYAAAKHNDESYLMTADHSLVGPLSAQKVLSIPGITKDYVKDVAGQTGLSASTIQRIISVTELLGTNEITTQDLASTLQVTVANANRFMNALLKGGFAEVTAEKKSYSKGRPSRVYRILLSERDRLS